MNMPYRLLRQWHRFILKPFDENELGQALAKFKRLAGTGLRPAALSRQGT